MEGTLEKLLAKYPELSACETDIQRAFETLRDCFQGGGKLLVCGNGGSAADAEHIVGELMKGFMLRRPVSEADRAAFVEQFGEDGTYLADHLQGALPAVSLVGHSALSTAYANDVAPDLVFAQQVYGYGRDGDVLLAISTSGNSNNVLQAVRVARLKGLRTIALTGRDGGLLRDLCELSIVVPADSTPDIQERHLPIYHALCIMLEEAFFQQ
ncbi:MAG TPA: SIS domain-containing protein [Bacillales bacterium]|nr:SIS domain-containing protein [Bacillales bacterium]